MKLKRTAKGGIWSGTTDGLRLRHATGLWWINATVDGKSVNECTKLGRNDLVAAQAYKEAYIADLRAMNKTSSKTTLTASKTLAPFIADWLRHLISEEKKVGPLTHARKLREFDYVQERWAGFRKSTWTIEDRDERGQPSPLGLEDPRDISVLLLHEFQLYLSSPAEVGGKPRYVACVVNRYVRIITQLLEVVEENVPGFNAPHKDRRFSTIPIGARKDLGLPSKAEFRAVMAYLRNEDSNAHREDTADLAEGLAYSNLRIDEARQLRVEHIDLVGHQGVDENGVPYHIGYLRLPASICKGKLFGRVIPITGAAFVHFKRLVRDADSNRGFIFKANSCRRALKRACVAVGCRHLNHHKLRHWWATITLEKTSDVKQVAEWLGHRDGGKLVLATYSHTRPERTVSLARLLTDDYGAPVAAVA